MSDNALKNATLCAVDKAPKCEWVIGFWNLPEDKARIRPLAEEKFTAPSYQDKNGRWWTAHPSYTRDGHPKLKARWGTEPYGWTPLSDFY